MIKLASGAIRLLAVLALLPFAIDWRSPLLASVRPPALAILVAVPLLVLAVELWRVRVSPPEGGLIRALRFATIAVCAAVLLATLGPEARFHWVRHQGLATDTNQLERVGRHVIVGFRDLQELRALVERRAIAGVFL